MHDMADAPRFDNSRNVEMTTQHVLGGLGQRFLVLDGDLGPRVGSGNREALFFQQRHMLLDAPFCLVQAVLDRVPDPGETFEVGRIETKKRWIVGCFNDKRIFQIDHTYLLLEPGRFENRIASPYRNFFFTMIIDPDQSVHG